MTSNGYCVAEIIFQAYHVEAFGFNEFVRKGIDEACDHINYNTYLANDWDWLEEWYQWHELGYCAVNCDWTFTREVWENA